MAPSMGQGKNKKQNNNITCKNNWKGFSELRRE
jgi:hypothetical protein